jgi:probable F420-dependent oxidoreductase
VTETREGSPQFGIYLGRLNPNVWVEVAEAADALGFESLWMPEHLVLPLQITGSPQTHGDGVDLPPSTPTFDAPVYLAYLAAKTTRIRLGTWVYNLALRHPFVAARQFQTLDIATGGRAMIGIGAGWLAEEWAATGVDFASRGRRLDEAIEVCRLLWTEAVVEYHGEFFDFDAVAFEPKPVQKPHPPVLIGGESEHALRRAARAGDGWMGMMHTPMSAANLAIRVRSMRDPDDLRTFSITVGALMDDGSDITPWLGSGVDRLIVHPWRSSSQAVSALERFAARFIDPPEPGL